MRRNYFPFKNTYLKKKPGPLFFAHRFTGLSDNFVDNLTLSVGLSKVLLSLLSWQHITLAVRLSQCKQDHVSDLNCVCPKRQSYYGCAAPHKIIIRDMSL